MKEQVFLHIPHRGPLPGILKISCSKQRFKHRFHGNSEIYQFHELLPRGISSASCKEYIHAQFENTLAPRFAYRAVH